MFDDTLTKLCTSGLAWINLHRRKNSTWCAELWHQEETKPTALGVGTTILNALSELSKHAGDDVIEDYEWQETAT